VRVVAQKGMDWQKEHTAGRRDFLSLLLRLWSMFAVVPVGNVILRFIAPLKNNDFARESLRVGGVADILQNSAKIVRFNKDPVIVVRTEQGQFKAFSARCTHLGCIVQFKTDDGPPHFACNCHQSQFDINGNNFAGPAPRPLTALKVSVVDSSIIVTKV
jgi:cytochrome b6-f complex iron-sulfur subunit